MLMVTRQYFNDQAYFDLLSTADISNERDLTEAFVKNVRNFPYRTWAWLFLPVSANFD